MLRAAYMSLLPGTRLVFTYVIAHPLKRLRASIWYYMANLCPGKRKGYYIYKRKDKFIAQKRYPAGYSKCAVLYTLEDAIAWLLALP